MARWQNMLSRWCRINLPFVTDLIDVPTIPTYRIEENRFGGYKVIKSKVGFVHFEDTFVIEGTLHEIKDVNFI